jgi:PhnB protein
MKAMFPPEKHGRLINARLISGAIEISATDWMASPDFNPILGNQSALFIESDDEPELRGLFDKLSDGADQARFQALHPMPFGLYGQFYDRFGVQWIFRGYSEH